MQCDEVVQGLLAGRAITPSAKMSSRRREQLQDTSRQLYNVLRVLIHLISATYLLVALPHVGPPHLCSQKSIHPPSPEVSGYLTAVGLVQQHLLMHPRYYKP